MILSMISGCILSDGGRCCWFASSGLATPAYTTSPVSTSTSTMNTSTTQARVGEWELVLEAAWAGSVGLAVFTHSIQHGAELPVYQAKHTHPLRR